MEMIRRFGADAYAQALASWDWLEGLAGMTPALTNAFGDVFLQGQDGSFSFLDTVGGRLDRVWSDAASLQADINTPSSQDEYLMGWAGPSRRRRRTDARPAIRSCRSRFRRFSAATCRRNLEVSDFVVADERGWPDSRPGEVASAGCADHWHHHRLTDAEHPLLPQVARNAGRGRTRHRQADAKGGNASPCVPGSRRRARSGCQPSLASGTTRVHRE